MPVRRPVLAAMVVALVARVAAGQTCNLNPDGPDQLVFTVTEAGSDFDLGWTGDYHDLQVPGGARLELCLTGCDTAADSLCDVEGYAAGQSAAGRSFAPPIPAVIGDFAGCIVTTFQEPFATGTADIASGAVEVTANIAASVFLTSPSAVCPTCTGAAAGESGTCVGGATPGAPCTTGEVITVEGATGNPYRVSRDCLPAGTTPLVTAFSLVVTTGVSTQAGLCPGQSSDDDCGAGTCSAACGPGGSGGVSQSCCSTATSKRCFPSPLQRTGATSVPLAAWPDPTYPKTSAGTLVSAFCAPAVPGLAGLVLNADVGLPGQAAFVLPVDGEWILDPSPVTTTTVPATTTTTPTSTSSTTSTTLECTSGADCADGDPCTDDQCNAGVCANPPLGGTAGADCELGQLLEEPACGDGVDAKVATALGKAVGRARTAVQKVDSASAKKRKKLLKSADKALKGFLRTVGKAEKKGRVPAGCAAALRERVGALRTDIQGL